MHSSRAKFEDAPYHPLRVLSAGHEVSSKLLELYADDLVIAAETLDQLSTRLSDWNSMESPHGGERTKCQNEEDKDHNVVV